MLMRMEEGRICCYYLLELILILAHWIYIIVDILRDGDLIFAFIFIDGVIVLPFSLSFSLSTLLLFRLLLSVGSVNNLFSFYDPIVPWPLTGGDPSCHHHVLLCVYP